MGGHAASALLLAITCRTPTPPAITAITTPACLPLPAGPCCPSPQDFKDQCEAYITLYGPLVFNMLITYLQVSTGSTRREDGSSLGTPEGVAAGFAMASSGQQWAAAGSLQPRWLATCSCRAAG
jgi:hypothetical protein